MKEIESFKTLISHKLYYEAHEALEELWFPIRKLKDNYCLVLKGFINAAVSLELYKRDKKEQSKKIYLVYKKYVIIDRIAQIDNSKEYIKLQHFIDNKFNDIEY